MVDMAVSEPDLLHGDAGLLDGVQDLRHVAAGIDHHGLLGRLVPDDGAILLEQRHGDDDRARFRACLGLCLVLLGHGATMPIFAMPPSKRFVPWLGTAAAVVTRPSQFACCFEPGRSFRVLPREKQLLDGFPAWLRAAAIGGATASSIRSTRAPFRIQTATGSAISPAFCSGYLM